MRIYPPHQDRYEGKPLIFRDIEDSELLAKMIGNGWTHDKAVSLGLKEPSEPIIPIEKEEESESKRRGRPKKGE